MLPPIKLTLYDANDEEIETYERSRIPWGILKKAVSLQKKIDEAETKPEESAQWWEVWKTLKKSGEKMTTEEAQIQAVSQFVVDLFGNKFTVRQLDEGADMSEIMSVFRAVIARANQAMNDSGVNPIIPSPRK